MPSADRQTHRRRSVVAGLVWMLAFQVLPAAAGTTPAAVDPRPAGDVYQQRSPSRDGIGKIYLGREISHVMGHLGAGWLERESRQAEERTDLLIDSLPLRADSVVADIGAGTGYFSFPVAARVPEGQVFAVDIQQEMLDIIERRRREAGASNVKTVLGTVSDPGLPAGAVDLIFIVDAYHEFSHPREMGEAMVRALRPGGRLVLVEYRAEDRRVPIKRLHKMSEAQAEKEMAALGLALEVNERFLPQQHVLIFRKPEQIVDHGETVASAGADGRAAAREDSR